MIPSKLTVLVELAAGLNMPPHCELVGIILKNRNVFNKSIAQERELEVPQGCPPAGYEPGRCDRSRAEERESGSAVWKYFLYAEIQSLATSFCAASRLSLPPQTDW